MKAVKHSMVRWAAVLSLSFGLAACGGGGGGDAAPLPTPTPDARNGDYTMVAANAREYTLTLDFDARTYRVAGDGVNQSGSFTAQADAFHFQPGNSVGLTGTSTLRFTAATDAVIGEFALPEGALPFIAARNFVTTVAGAAGTYNMLGRRVDTAGGAPDTSVQQGEITAGGQLRVCDNSLSPIAGCPSSSVTSGTITVSGNLFTATTAGGGILFRVAQIGADKVFLRGSVSSGTTRRFIVGTPVTPTFTGDTFVGGTTEPAWGTATVTATSFSSTGTTPTGLTVTRSGTVTAVPGIESLRRADAGTAGIFFAARSSELGIVASEAGSSTAPGFLAIGRKQ